MENWIEFILLIIFQKQVHALQFIIIFCGIALRVKELSVYQLNCDNIIIRNGNTMDDDDLLNS